MVRSLLNAAAAAGVLSLSALGQTALPEFLVRASRVANQTAAGTIDMPVSILRFEPRVDVQSRNLAEAQADIAIRGGLFEGTGFRLGGAPLADPQTGHYAAELPVPPVMLLVPEVVTGLTNAAEGFQATAGTVRYGWAPIRPRRAVAAAFGGDGFRRQSVYAAAAGRGGAQGWFADAEWARSEGDGSLPGGDHRFTRIAGRLQRLAGEHQTDLFVGYQTKFFGWPNLYTPFGFNESENLQTGLMLANHRLSGDDGQSVEAAVFYRRHRDDYEFNRAVPGASNPFEHTTWVRGVAAAATWPTGPIVWTASGTTVADRIESTSLLFGRHRDRRLAKLSLAPAARFGSEGSRLSVRGGFSWDHSDRDGTVFSPLGGIEWQRGDLVLYAEHSCAAQLPTYTALNSSASAGLFRGNPELGWTRSGNSEVGGRLAVGSWLVELAAFERRDRDLVDWTFRRGVMARTANAVDMRTRGLEAILSRRIATLELVLGYGALQKRGDYGSSLVDASFYALNFPRHRATAAVVWRFAPGWELRVDNEYRRQEGNVLRVLGGDEAWLSSLGLYLAPESLRGWEFSLLVDNAWGSDFQEVPAVPAAGRQWAAGASWRW